MSSENGREPTTRKIDVASGSIELEAAESLLAELIRAVAEHGVTVTISIYPFGEVDVETTETPTP